MRECGSCTMCCKLLGIPELKKPASEWCPNCAIGKGCRIYAERPASCADFECMYKLMQKAEIGLRPDKCKVVIAPTTNPDIVSAQVDPGYPTAWQREPVASLLRNLAETGLTVVIGTPNSIVKTVLMKKAKGIVGMRTITMTAPDEEGMQWYEPEKAI